MRRIASIHLYLGCLFAPLIILYSLSGAWQSLNLHRSTKDGRYQAPKTLVAVSEVHLRQRLLPAGNDGTTTRRQAGDALFALLPRKAFPWLSALLGLSLAVTSCLGIILAFVRSRRRRRWLAALSLAAGCAIPVTLLLS